MLKHILKRFWKLIVAILGTIVALILVIDNFSTIYHFYKRFADSIHQIMKEPLCIIILLFVLIALSLLLLTLYLRCIFKKQNTLTNIIETKSNDTYQDFRPDKNMITVLLLLKDGLQLYRHQIQSKLNFSHDLSEHCIDELDRQCFVYVVHPDDLLDQLNTARSDLKLELSDVGRKYLIENNLL